MKIERAGSDSSCPSVHLPSAPQDLRAQLHRTGGAARIDVDADRAQAFRVDDAFFQRLFDFLVIERVRRAVDHAFAIRHGDAAPAAQQFEDAGRLAGRSRACPLGADRMRVRKEFRGHLGVLSAPARPHSRLAAFDAQLLVALQELLDLHRVVRQRFGRRVDGRQAAADHQHRQPQLHVRERAGLGRAGELQRHQEVRRSAHAARQSVRDVEHRRAPGAHRQCDVIEAELESVLQRQRATEPHATEHRELRAPFQQQPHQFQEVLVPAHRDAVFGDAAEAGQDAVLQRLAQIGHVAYRFESAARSVAVHAAQAGRQRLDLQAVDADDGMALVHEFMRQRVAGRTEAGHQHTVAAARLRIRPAQVERIPARQQRIQLEAIRQLQHVFQRAGFDLRNVHRFLLLVDAGLEAVIADAVSGRGHHRVVDGDHRQRGDGVAVGLQHVKFGYALGERATGQRDLECRLLVRRLAAGRRRVFRCLFLQAL